MKAIIIKDLAKKWGRGTPYFILQFFNKKKLLKKYFDCITFLNPCSPRWKKYRITKIGSKYVYFIKYGEEKRECYI